MDKNTIIDEAVEKAYKNLTGIVDLNILIVGKYFNRAKDFIYAARVCKKYEEFIDMYHFNPISEIEIFEKMETLVIYENYFNYNNINVEDNDELLYSHIDKKLKEKCSQSEKFKYFQIDIQYKLTYNQYTNFKTKFPDDVKNNRIKFRNVIYDRRTRRQADKEKGSEEEHTVPEGVNIIDDNCFEGSKVVKVILPSTVKEIKENAFNKCKHLETIEINGMSNVYFEVPYHIGKILKASGINTFKYVYTKEDRVKYFKAENNTIPDKVVRLAANCFRDTNIQNIVINEGIKSIGEMCFFNCKKLETITLPKTLRELGKRAFENCLLLEKIDVPMGVAIIPFRFCACSGVETVVLPSTVSVLSYETFSECEKLENIIIPAGMKSIGSACFERCISLVRINIPSKSLKSIPERCFDECFNLKEVVFDDEKDIDSLHFGNNCFGKCFSLKNQKLLIF